MSVMRSFGWSFRQTWMALCAPAASAGSKVAGSEAAWGMEPCGKASEIKAVVGFVDDVVHDLFEIFGAVVNLNLPVGAGAMGEDLLDVVHLGAGAEVVHDVVDELEQLGDEVAGGDLLGFAEIDHLAVDAIAGGAPTGLIDEG